MRLLKPLLCFLLCSVLMGFVEQPGITKNYSNAAAQIIGSALIEERAFENLEYLTDKIGHRLSGSPQLEQAVDWALNTMRSEDSRGGATTLSQRDGTLSIRPP